MLLTGIMDGEYQYLHKRTKKELIYCCGLQVIIFGSVNI